MIFIKTKTNNIKTEDFKALLMPLNSIRLDSKSATTLNNLTTLTSLIDLNVNKKEKSLVSNTRKIPIISGIEINTKKNLIY